MKLTMYLAYLDPATGSMALQIAIGGVVTALAAVKLFWSKLKTLGRKPASEPEAAEKSR
ncbi:MAG: hypothetical protein HYR60_08100 [Acidobacteria bacterium]|nr:hypothetical protein [Acidobacteriota bacterium]